MMPRPFPTRVRLLLVAASLLTAACAGAPASGPAPIAARATDCRFLQPWLDSLHAAGRFPGATLGVAFPDGSSCALAAGWSDTACHEPMRPEHLLMSGSVGKTYVAALALQRVAEGRLALDAPISSYLGQEPWFGRLPNARQVTVRQLMNHTSGLVRYELNPRFLADLAADRDHVWTAEERLTYLFDATPPFAAGEGWDYSDTNYIVLGMILERIGRRPLYEQVRERLTTPLGLRHTVPTDRRRIEGLAQGYAGPENPFGGTDAMVLPDGRFAVNPQFEWAGGGYASTADDLARWIQALFRGQAYPAELLPLALEGPATPALGPGTRYGLGVIVSETPLGTSFGHSGYMPGYITEARYWPENGVAVVLQINTSVPRALGRPAGEAVRQVAERVLARA
jgi:D-alanyl-D-alanine carboxypeptidase